MDIKNSETRFGWMAISLHWVMAILVIGLLAVGLYMSDLPNGAEKNLLYGWHKEFGVLVLMLVLFRLFWRITNITPFLNLPWYEQLAARSVHWLFYGFMVVMPLSGWLMSSAAGYPPSFFGLFNMPNLVAPNPDLAKLFFKFHEYLAYVLIALIVIHTLAAIKHHFIDKDDILKRMIS